MVNGPWYAVDHLIEVLDQPPAPHRDDDNPRYFGWHPLPLAEWLTGMQAAYDHLVERNRCWSGEESFLDVGAGTGTKMAFAHQLGWGHVEGVERHGPYADTCRARWSYKVTVCDALDFDRYDKFDLVYSYRLCVDPDDQRELTARIVSRMRPGALIFLAGGPDPHGLVEVGPGVWEV